MFSIDHTEVDDLTLHALIETLKKVLFTKGASSKESFGLFCCVVFTKYCLGLSRAKLILMETMN